MKKFGKFLTLQFLAFLLNSYAAEAQSFYQKSIKVSYEIGPLISNGTEWGDQVKDLVTYRAIDVQFSWRDFSQNVYSSLYRHPRYGLGFNSTLFYSKEIGQPVSVYGFFDIPFTYPKPDQKVEWGYFSQIGLGFNLKPFDPENNPMNQYIGSKVNSYIHLGFYSSISFSSRLEGIASVGLKHYSNGSTKKPNAGINLFPVSLGVNIKLGELVEPSINSPIIAPFQSRRFWNFAIYSGVKNYEIGAPSYFRGGVGINYLIQPDYKYKYGLGMDFFWAQGMNFRLPGNNYSFGDQTSVAIVGSWEWQLSENLYLPIGLGVYLDRNELNQEVTPYYERVGVRYKFSNNLFTGLQIKAHKAKADFFEFTVGYTLHTQ